MTLRAQRPRRLVDDVDGVTRHRHAGRAVLHRQRAEADGIAGDAPAGLGLPPMVDHRDFQHVFRPGHRRRIGALAGKKQRAEFRQIVFADLRAGRIVLLDGAERRRRGEQSDDAMIGADAPERAGIGRADRLALVHDRRRAMKQRRIDDVAVPDHPADVGGAPPHLAGIDAVEIFHRPFERDQMPAIVAHHAFGDAGRARGVENVERIGGEHRHAIDRFLLGVMAQLRPIVVAPGHHGGLALRPLQDDAAIGLVARERDRLVEQRLILHHAAGLDAAARRHHEFRLGVVDAGRELLRREAAEHHAVDRADARAGEHGDHRLRYHRHVKNDAVAFGDSEILQNGGKDFYFRQQFAIGEDALGIGDRRIVNERHLPAAAFGDVAVERVPAGVADRAGEPAAINAGIAVEHFLCRLDPVDFGRGLGPKAFRVALPARINFRVAALGAGIHPVFLPGLCDIVRRAARFAITVIAGPDPAIHHAKKIDPRVKPGGDAFVVVS